MAAMFLAVATLAAVVVFGSSDALAGAYDVARELGPDGLVIVNLSGRGDKDMETAMRWFGLGDA